MDTIQNRGVAQFHPVSEQGELSVPLEKGVHGRHVFETDTNGEVHFLTATKVLPAWTERSFFIGKQHRFELQIVFVTLHE